MRQALAAIASAVREKLWPGGPAVNVLHDRIHLLQEDVGSELTRVLLDDLSVPDMLVMEQPNELIIISRVEEQPSHVLDHRFQRSTSTRGDDRPAGGLRLYRGHAEVFNTRKNEGTATLHVIHDIGIGSLAQELDRWTGNAPERVS